jgi:hypothetical protein
MTSRIVQRLAASTFGVAVAAVIPFLAEKGTEPKGHAVVWGLYSLIVGSAIVWALATLARRQSGGPASPLQEPPRAALSDRASLAHYLEERIVEVGTMQRVVAEEAAKPVPDVLRLDGIQAAFAQLNTEVARRLRVTAPEWERYWDEDPDWFPTGLTLITSEQFVVLARFYGWVAARMLHIKSRLP